MNNFNNETAKHELKKTSQKHLVHIIICLQSEFLANVL